MKPYKLFGVAVALLLAIVQSPLGTLYAQGTAFTYQGRFQDGGAPAHGLYDLRFRLFLDSAGNTQVGGTLLTNGVPMTNGLFVVTLDFGPGIFTGSSYWLQIDARTNGAANYVSLSPLQQLTPAPYAVFAEGASNVLGVVPGSGLSGTYSGVVSFNNVGDSFTGNGSGLTGVNAATVNGLSAASFWQIGGNAGTTPGANYVGTSDNRPFELHVNGLRALRLEPNTNGAPNVLGGAPINYIPNSIVGATIAGGGADIYNGSAYSNSILANFGTVGGGFQNTVAGQVATVSGGFWNSASGLGAFIGGGAANTATGGGSTISGGQNNTNNAAGATIAGGEYNLASGYGAFIGGGGYDGSTFAGNLASGVGSVVAGGLANQATNGYAAVAGGEGNVAGGIGSFVGGGGYAGEVVRPNVAAGAGSVISGGLQNWAGDYGTVGGGFVNSASGVYSVVAGGVGNAAYAFQSTVGGGSANSALATNSTVAGGTQNIASGVGAFIGGGGIDGGGSVAGNYASGGAATIGGGVGNQATNYFATVAGGLYNTANNRGAIGGGNYNLATGWAAAIGGGEENTGSGLDSTVSGGFLNSASGAYAAVPGGYENRASGFASFAVGDEAQALHAGAFVWADSQGNAYASDRANEFKVRAAGGMLLDVSGSSGLNPAALRINSTSGNGVGIFVAQTSSDATAVFTAAGTGDIIKGFNGGNGGNPVFEVVNSGDVYAHSFTSTSDRNAKDSFTTVEPQDVLAKVVALPVTEWRYKTDPKDQRHIGPVAQDFHAAFGLNGPDDKHISLLDEGGVALAAIKGLNQKLESENAALRGELQRRDADLAALQRRLEALERTFQARRN